MMAQHTPTLTQLQQICRQASAYWAVWLQRAENQWQILAQHNLTPAKQTALQNLFGRTVWQQWLNRVPNGRLPRGRVNPLGDGRIFRFGGEDAALVVCADSLEAASAQWLHVVALGMPHPSKNGSDSEQYRVLEVSLRHLQAVRETALDIASDLDLEALLRRAVRRARELVQAARAEVALLQEDGAIFSFVSDELQPALQLRTLIMQTAQRGTPLIYTDPAALGVPLKLKGLVIGVLAVADDTPGRTFSPTDVQLLELLAPQMAVFIRNARLYQELQERMDAQRQTENQLVRSARLAAVGEMAAGVAHELNNPLTTVAGFVELALDELAPDSPLRADLQLVLREAHRARGVVRRLLDFSRPAENVRIRTDLNELVSDVLTLVQHLVRTGGVEIRIKLWDDLPSIKIDPNQIKQVLLNLVHNALQAMPRGGTLTIQTTRQQRDEQLWLTVMVQDTGDGIPPEHMERLFEPFFTTRPVGSGTGLGLSVSYGIVKEHQGFIEVDSALGSGSAFTVWLPVKDHE
ncbi:MAG: hypothetical protein OHK0052_24580 [Anaerolineales bacterium]